MKDRIPTYPGRVKLTVVDAANGIYDMVRADEPTEAGTLLNKANLLSDATASLMGLGATATVNGMLNKLATVLNATSADATEALEAVENILPMGIQTYTGTGSSGSANYNQLEWDFVPALMVIYDMNDGTQVAKFYPRALGTSAGTTAGYAYNEAVPTTTTQRAYVSADGKTVKWYTTSTTTSTRYKMQMNVSGHSYIAVAIGGDI